MNTVMLNHFPAYKWAPIKISILRRAFYRAINTFIKMWWIDYKIILGSKNLHQHFTLNLKVWVLPISDLNLEMVHYMEAFLTYLTLLLFILIKL